MRLTPIPIQVDFRREMRPIAFVDPEAFHSTNLAKLPTSRLQDNFRKAHPLIGGGAGLPTTWGFHTRYSKLGVIARNVGHPRQSSFLF